MSISRNTIPRKSSCNSNTKLIKQHTQRRWKPHSVHVNTVQTSLPPNLSTCLDIRTRIRPAKFPVYSECRMLGFAELFIICFEGFNFHNYSHKYGCTTWVSQKYARVRILVAFVWPEKWTMMFHISAVPSQKKRVLLQRQSGWSVLLKMDFIWTW